MGLVVIRIRRGVQIDIVTLGKALIALDILGLQLVGDAGNLDIVLAVLGAGLDLAGHLILRVADNGSGTKFASTIPSPEMLLTDAWLGTRKK